MAKTSSLLIVAILFAAYYTSYVLYRGIQQNNFFEEKSSELTNLIGKQIDHHLSDFVDRINAIDSTKKQTSNERYAANETYIDSKATIKQDKLISNIIQNSESQTGQKNRQLQQSQTGDNYFLEYSLMIFAKYFGFSRNLIIFGTFTLMIDYMLPLIIFNESFLMLAFWTNDKHLLTPFYQQIFNAKYDLMNVIRLGVTSTDNTALEILQRYGYSSGFFYNISGQFLFTVILGILTAIIKIVNIFLKLEKVRQLNSKLRPIWNGYVFCIMPRIMMFIGFQARSVLEFSLFNIVNIIVAVIALILMITYFVLLVIQVRRINARVQYLEDSRLQIGLAGRIDFKKDFDFDCLNYSILHYPGMNYLRLLWFFLAIGASPDFHYVQYSIPIISQTIYIMISISCPCYERNRDKVVYVIGDFLFIILSLATIATGLAQSVNHSEVSLVAETIIMVIILQVTLTYTGLVIADTIDYFRQQRNKVKETQEEQQELESSNQSEIEQKKHDIEIYKKQETREGVKSGQKTKRKQQKRKQTESDSDGDQDQESSQASEKADPDSALTIKRNLKHPEASVKKVRIGGKVI